MVDGRVVDGRAFDGRVVGVRAEDGRWLRAPFGLLTKIFIPRDVAVVG